MPSGQKHDDLWRKAYLAPIFASVFSFTLLEFTLSYIYPYSCLISNLYCFTNSLLISIGIPLGYLLGRVVTPDMDMIGITKTEWDILRKGKLLGVFFIMYWMPYAYLVSHRSYLSHSYMFSSFIRMIYMFWWVMFLHPINLVLFILFGIFFGLSVSDGIHIWADENIKEKK